MTVLAHCCKAYFTKTALAQTHDSPGTLPVAYITKPAQAEKTWQSWHSAKNPTSQCLQMEIFTHFLCSQANLHLHYTSPLTQSWPESSHITILCLPTLCHWNQLLSCKTAALPQEAKGDLRMIAGTCATMPDTSRWRQFPRYSIAACSWLGVRAPRGVLWRLSRSKYITSLPYTNLMFQPCSM